jgi:PAS domain S-box-containing protein
MATETESKRLELLESRLEWYKAIFDNATDAFFIVQPDSWEILDINEFGSQLLGYTKDDIIGSRLPQFKRIFKLLKKSSSPIVLSELSLDRHEDGEPLMLEVSARFLDIDGSEVIYAIARDVSEQHALTDKMVQADKLVLLGQLSAGVAHELRNPLAAVNLNLQVLKRKMDNESAEFSYVDMALQGVERISKIVDVTLNFSRPAMPDVQNIDINQLIPNVLELTRSNIKRKDVTIDLDLDPELPTVNADGKQIQQVFINLITNALDAIETKGRIDIQTFREDGQKSNEGSYVVVSVKDDGIGMPPEELTKIFNPFFTRKSEGTGLGLPITQRILHQHNGIIDVESQKGKGTTFYVKLPITL